jgi:hypothetical protein
MTKDELIKYLDDEVARLSRLISEFESVTSRAYFEGRVDAFLVAIDYIKTIRSEQTVMTK